MERNGIVRQSAEAGDVHQSVGDRPTAPCGEGGESPSFILSLTNAQIDALCSFVESHGFWAHNPDHHVDSSATWSSDLSTVQELHISCSCGYYCTFNRSGKEVTHA